uniref:Ubiquitin-activating enzyme e1, putative n=1 Tax=Neospora caninum (strain Liverpool) TaxID=572307 RepID=A0A0F7UNN2_NEOCL|nr:TPA: ubiquitin-activating enzyme e1, putative [Neospora caninum Liverpool]
MSEVPDEKQKAVANPSTMTLRLGRTQSAKVAFPLALFAPSLLSPFFLALVVRALSDRPSFSKWPSRRNNLLSLSPLFVSLLCILAACGPLLQTSLPPPRPPALPLPSPRLSRFSSLSRTASSLGLSPPSPSASTELPPPSLLSPLLSFVSFVGSLFHAIRVSPPVTLRSSLPTALPVLQNSARFAEAGRLAFPAASDSLAQSPSRLFFSRSFSGSPPGSQRLSLPSHGRIASAPSSLSPNLSLPSTESQPAPCSFSSLPRHSRGCLSGAVLSPQFVSLPLRVSTPSPASRLSSRHPRVPAALLSPLRLLCHPSTGSFPGTASPCPSVSRCRLARSGIWPPLCSLFPPASAYHSCSTFRSFPSRCPSSRCSPFVCLPGKASESHSSSPSPSSGSSSHSPSSSSRVPRHGSVHDLPCSPSTASPALDASFSQSPSTSFLSREWPIYGREHVARLPRARVLLVGLQGVGVEAAKCLLLAGVGRLSLLDNDPPSGPEEASANFAIPNEGPQGEPLNWENPGEGETPEAGWAAGDGAHTAGAGSVPGVETEGPGGEAKEGHNWADRGQKDCGRNRDESPRHRRTAASRAMLAYAALKRLTLPHSRVHVVTDLGRGEERERGERASGGGAGTAGRHLKGLLASTDVVVLSNSPLDEVIHVNRLCREIQRERREARRSGTRPAGEADRYGGPYLVAVWTVGLAGRLFVDFGDTYSFGPPNDAHIDLPLASRFSAAPAPDAAEGALQTLQSRRRRGEETGKEEKEETEETEGSRLGLGDTAPEKEGEGGAAVNASRARCRLHYRPLDEALRDFGETSAPGGRPNCEEEIQDTQDVGIQPSDQAEEDEETKRQQMLHVAFLALDALLTKRRNAPLLDSSPTMRATGDFSAPLTSPPSLASSFSLASASLAPSHAWSFLADPGRSASPPKESEDGNVTGRTEPHLRQTPLRDDAVSGLCSGQSEKEAAEEILFVEEQAIRLWRRRRQAASVRGRRGDTLVAVRPRGTRPSRDGQNMAEEKREGHEGRERKTKDEAEVRVVARDLYRSMAGHIAPVASIMGGLAAQEALKALSARFTPFHQFFYFDALDILPSPGLPSFEVPREASLRLRRSSFDSPSCSSSSSPSTQLASSRSASAAATSSSAPASPPCSVSSSVSSSPPRWLGQERLLGSAVQTRLGSLHLFLAGAGAVGCELLKLFALMGVGCRPQSTASEAETPRAALEGNLAEQKAPSQGSVSAPDREGRIQDASQEMATPTGVIQGEEKTENRRDERERGRNERKGTEGEEGEDEGGCVTVADADFVERSNLNRQLLFTEKDVRRPKAVAAAEAASKLNRAMRVRPICAFVGTETEGQFFNWAFWRRQNLVAMALDTVAARMYLDSQCLLYQKPLVEAGTLGLRGHAQSLVPHLTESYGSTADPRGDDEEAPQPTCSVRLFPSSPLHLVQWASEAFNRTFGVPPERAGAFLVELDAVLRGQKGEETREREALGDGEEKNNGRVSNPVSQEMERPAEMGTARPAARVTGRETTTREEKGETKTHRTEACVGSSLKAAFSGRGGTSERRGSPPAGPRDAGNGRDRLPSPREAGKTSSESTSETLGETNAPTAGLTTQLAKEILNLPSVRDVPMHRSHDLADIFGTALDSLHVHSFQTRNDKEEEEGVRKEEGRKEEGREGVRKEEGREGVRKEEERGEGREEEREEGREEEREEGREEGRQEEQTEKLMCFFVDRALGLFHRFFVEEIECLSATAGRGEESGGGETLPGSAEEAHVDRKAMEENNDAGAVSEQDEVRRQLRVTPLSFSEDDEDSLMFICTAAKLLSQVHGVSLDVCAARQGASDEHTGAQRPPTGVHAPESDADGADWDPRVVRKLLRDVQRQRRAASLSEAAKLASENPLSALAWLRNGALDTREKKAERRTWRRWLSSVFPKSSSELPAAGPGCRPSKATRGEDLDRTAEAVNVGELEGVLRGLRPLPETASGPSSTPSTVAHSLRLIQELELVWPQLSAPSLDSRSSLFSSPPQASPSAPPSADSALPQARRLFPLTYNKDASVHLRFLTATARLRGQCFRFSDLPDLLAVQQLSGRIVPATSTATTVAAGLAALEIYRLVQANLLGAADSPRERRAKWTTEGETAHAANGEAGGDNEPRVRSPYRVFSPSCSVALSAHTGRAGDPGTRRRPCLVMESLLDLACSGNKQGRAGAELVTPSAWHVRLRTAKRREKARRRLRSSFFNLSAPFLTQVTPLPPPSASVLGGQLAGRTFTPWDCLRLVLKAPESTRGRGETGPWSYGHGESRLGGEASIDSRESQGASRSARDVAGLARGRDRQEERFQARTYREETPEEGDGEEERGDLAASLVTVDDVVRMLEDTLGVRVMVLTCEDSVLFSREESDGDAFFDWRAFWNPVDETPADTNGSLSALAPNARERVDGRAEGPMKDGTVTPVKEKAGESTETLAASPDRAVGGGTPLGSNFQFSSALSSSAAVSSLAGSPPFVSPSEPAAVSASSRGFGAGPLRPEAGSGLADVERKTDASLADTIREILRRTRGERPFFSRSQQGPVVGSAESDGDRNERTASGLGSARSCDPKSAPQAVSSRNQRREKDSSREREKKDGDDLSWVIVDVVAVDEENNEMAVPQLKLCISTKTKKHETKRRGEPGDQEAGDVS